MFWGGASSHLYKHRVVLLTVPNARMSLHGMGRIVDSDRYTRFLDGVLSAAADADAEVETAGAFSNGDDRPVVRFDGGDAAELLIVAGEDEEEFGPIAAMPEIIRSIGALDVDVSVNVVPLFDSYSLEAHLGLDEPVVSYDALSDRVSGEMVTYAQDEVRERFRSGQMLAVRSSFDEEELDAVLEGVTEVGVHPSGVVAFDQAASKPTHDQISVVVGAFHGQLPEEFYIPVFGAGVLKPYRKQDASNGDDLTYRWRPLYGCFDLEPLPDGLVELKELAERCTSALALHSYRGDDFFLFSEGAPYELTDGIVDRVGGAGMDVADGEELERTEYVGETGVREGVVERRLDWEANLYSWVDEYNIVIEPSESQSARASGIAAEVYVEFHHYLT